MKLPRPYLLLLPLLLVLQLLLFLFISKNNAPSSSPSSPNIKYLKEGSVAILDQVGSNLYVKKCAGVWIDTYRFITARHCVEGNWVTYQNYQHNSLENFGTYPWGYVGLVVKVDSDIDLALIMGYGGDHNLVSVGEGIIGEGVWVVGHPNGYSYSVTSGILSSRRLLWKRGEYWQVDSNIGPGNSGGGMFNNRGELLGICSFINLDIARFGFFVSGGEILNFIKE